jgi:hypothetical protein
MKNRILVLGMVLVCSGAVLAACGDSTSPGPKPPVAPSNLAATPSSASEITLTWRDNSDNEASFELERCTGVGCNTFTDLATIPANTTGYQDQGLTAGASYSYRICAHNAGGDSYYSNTAAVTLGVTPPAAPSNLVATATSTTQIGLTWQDNSSNEDNFLLERCTGATCLTFTPIATLPANTTSYLDQGLTAGTSYRYRVRAHNAGGDSDYSSVATATTPASGLPPAAPTNLVATAASATQIDLTWQDNSSNEDNFVLDRCSGATCSIFTPIATLPANTTSYHDQGLTSGTTYRYQVRAHNAEGDSEYSSVATATTGAPGAPAAPTNLSYRTRHCLKTGYTCPPGYGLGYNVDLTWQDNSSDEAGFAIERCSDAVCPTFTQVATVAANTRRYVDKSLAAGTYRYRMRAYNAGGYSIYSNTIAVRVGPAAPTNLVATPISASQIALTWQDNSLDERNFLIERCTGTGCTGFAGVTTVPANTRSYQDQGLTSGTSYSYRVRACNAFFACSASNTATAVTP